MEKHIIDSLAQEIITSFAGEIKSWIEYAKEEKENSKKELITNVKGYDDYLSFSVFRELIELDEKIVVLESVKETLEEQMNAYSVAEAQVKQIMTGIFK